MVCSEDVLLSDLFFVFIVDDVLHLKTFRNLSRKFRKFSEKAFFSIFSMFSDNFSTFSESFSKHFQKF